MDKTNKVDEMEIYELPGETAVLVNGLPPVYPGDALVHCNVASDEELQKIAGFDESLLGRNITKLVGKQSNNENPRDGDLVDCYVASDVKLKRNIGFGEWLVGRKVKKIVGDQSYNGKVTEFDEKMGWYKVVYENGDGVDLEWHELQGVLEPLDIKVPLKAIAAKTIKRRKQFGYKSTKPM